MQNPNYTPLQHLIGELAAKTIVELREGNSETLPELAAKIGKTEEETRSRLSSVDFESTWAEQLQG